MIKSNVGYYSTYYFVPSFVRNIYGTNRYPNTGRESNLIFVRNDNTFYNQTVHVKEYTANYFSQSLLWEEKFIEMIASTVLTGYIFAYILNREPVIILPDKLVIRHRTSENVNHLLTLGVLVGNKSRFKIHDVRCTVSCFYVKKNKEPLLTNSEFQVFQEVHSIHNYFRFSFELEKFPRKILYDFIEKDPVCLELDAINVSIRGHSNLLGNTFMISKKYKLSDLVIDEHVPQITYSIKNPLSGKKILDIIRWDELNRIEEVCEKKRIKTIKEIKKIIDNKSKV